MRRRGSFTIGFAFLALQGLAAGGPPGPAARVAALPTPGSGPSASCPPRASIAEAALAYEPRGQTVDVWSVPLAGSAPEKVASLAREPDTPVTGTTVPGTAQIAITVCTRRERDPTWTGSVYVVAPGSPARLVLDGALAGGRLVASPGGVLYAVRGSAGPAQAAGAPGFRSDRLELVAIDLRSGAQRTVRAETGDALIPVGLVGDELVCYEVGAAPQGETRSDGSAKPSELVAIRVASGARRPLTPSAPRLARDFSLDPRAGLLWFTALHPGGDEDHRWAVYRLETASGKIAIAGTAATLALSPHAWPGGRVAFDCRQGQALCIADRPGGAEPLAAVGPGPARVQDVLCTREGAIAPGVKGREPFGVPFLLEVATGRSWSPALPRQRVLFLGAIPDPGRGPARGKEHER